MGQEEEPLLCTQVQSTDSTTARTLCDLKPHLCGEATIPGGISVVIKYRSQPDTYKKCSIHRKEECVSFNEKLGIAGREDLGSTLLLGTCQGCTWVGFGYKFISLPQSRCDGQSLTHRQGAG